MKKSEILKHLAVHLSVERLLAEHPRLGPGALSALLMEAAGKFGPGDTVPVTHAAPKGGGKKLILHTDGASRGNPGEAGIGVVIEDGSGQVVRTIARYLGHATNNQAEYEALCQGLAAAHELGASEVELYADSELVVKQINGEYRVKDPDLKVRYEKAAAMLSRFRKYSVGHVRRELNAEADALANRAIDKRL